MAQVMDKELQDASNKLGAGDYKEALLIYDKYVNSSEADSISLSWINVYSGMCQENLDNKELAIKHYKQAIMYKFPNLNVYNKLYKLAKESNDYPLQEFVLIQKHKMFPETKEEVMKSLCYVYANSQKFERLYESASFLSENYSKNYKYYYFKGLAKQCLGEIKEAIKNYYLAHELNPDDYGTNKNLGVLMYNMSSASYEAETTKYNSLKKPTRTDYHNYNVATKLIEQEYLKIEPFLIKSYEAKPDAGLKKALYNLYVRTGRKTLAIKFK